MLRRRAEPARPGRRSRARVVDRHQLVRAREREQSRPTALSSSTATAIRPPLATTSRRQPTSARSPVESQNSAVVRSIRIRREPARRARVDADRQPRRGGEVELAAHRHDVHARRHRARGSRRGGWPWRRGRDAGFGSLAAKWHSPPSTARSDPRPRPASPSPTRACCAATARFEVMRLYGGRPFALRRPLRPPARTVRGPAAGGRPRRAARPRSPRCSTAAAPGRRPAAHRAHPRRPADRDRSSRCPQRPPAARVATVTYAPDAHPGRAQDALLRRQHARRAARARSAASTRRCSSRRTAACWRGRRGRSSGSTGGAALHAAAGGPHPRLDHPRAAARGVRASRERRARSTTCAPPRRRSSPRPSARCMPIAAIDDIELPAAPGPVTQDAHARFQRASSASWPRRRLALATRGPSAVPADHHARGRWRR